MQSGAFYGVAHFAVAAAYLAFAARCWADLRRSGGLPPGGLVRLLLPLAVAGHGLLLAHEVFGEGGLRFGFAQASSASLFTAAKISHLGLLPQGQPERMKRAEAMVAQMNKEAFGSCTNIGECEAVCPKEIKLEVIARMNRDFLIAKLAGRGTADEA